MARINLITVASEVAREEGGARSAGGVAQVTEILGVLGRRWRAIPLYRALKEFVAIRNRAGLRDCEGEKRQ